MTENIGCSVIIVRFFSKFGIVFLVPYNKDFGRITQFCGNDVATVPFAAFCYNLRSNNSYMLQK